MSDDGRWWSSEENSPPIYIYRYNQTFVGQVGSEAHYPLGVELEIEFGEEEHKREFAAIVRDQYGRGVCHCKHDGSLSDYGVELVTGYGEWATISPIIANVSQIARKLGGKSHNTDTCGQHISVGRSNMSTAQQARYVVFFNHPDNQEALKKFARRYSPRYAEIKGYKAIDSFIDQCERDGDCLLGDKYEAVNCNHETHLEVRIFKGSLRTETTLARMALVGLVAEFCEGKRRAKDLVWNVFSEWLAARECAMSKSVLNYIVYMQKKEEKKSAVAYTENTF
jgi:hypothetical protein